MFLLHLKLNRENLDPLDSHILKLLSTREIIILLEKKSKQDFRNKNYMVICYTKTMKTIN